MTHPKSRRRIPMIWWFEDDPAEQPSLRDDLLDAADYHRYELRMFTYLLDAAGETHGPDIIVMDVGGLCHLGCSLAQSASPVRTLVARYPGAAYLLYSALNCLAVDVVEEVRRDNPEAVMLHVRYEDVTEKAAELAREWSP